MRATRHAAFLPQFFVILAAGYALVGEDGGMVVTSMEGVLRLIDKNGKPVNDSPRYRLDLQCNAHIPTLAARADGFSAYPQDDFSRSFRLRVVVDSTEADPVQVDRNES